MKKIREFLNNDVMFFRVVLLGIVLSMLSMFNCLNNGIDNIQDDVRVIIKGNSSIICQSANSSGTAIICSTPDYKYLLDNLY